MNSDDQLITRVRSKYAEATGARERIKNFQSVLADLDVVLSTFADFDNVTRLLGTSKDELARVQADLLTLTDHRETLSRQVAELKNERAAGRAALDAQILNSTGEHEAALARLTEERARAEKELAAVKAAHSAFVAKITGRS